MELVLRSGATTTILLVSAALARANPDGIVATAADTDNPADLHSTVEYDYEVDKATLFREQLGGGADPAAPLPTTKDLTFKQFRHTITPRAELGVYHDTWLSFALPIVVTQSRQLALADGVARDGSPTLLDGILPMQGFDAQDPGTAPPGDLVFRGVNRHGLDQVHLGLNVAPMSQHRDPTKPTWKLGGELRLAVGKIMRFDPANPKNETGVSKGVHELRVFTSVDKRFDRTEAYFEMFWQVPVANKQGSLFDDPGFGSTNVGLGQQAGSAFGVEVYAVDDKVNDNHISLDLGAKFDVHFEGRDYSEMWEAFAVGGDATSMGPLVLDSDPTADGPQAISHPGITNYENYLESTARAAVRAQLGPHVRFAASVDLVWKTDHVITFADAGVDLPTCGGDIVVDCETDPNDLVTPGTKEVNPVHVPLIDLVGHRYHSEQNFGLVIGVMGQVLF